MRLHLLSCVALLLSGITLAQQPAPGPAPAPAPGDAKGTRLVRLCCKDCIPTFQKEPAKYMAQIDAGLIAAQKKSYSLDTCPVSGEKIKGDGVDHLYGTRLVRFCCDKCVAGFDKEPAK